MFIINLKAFHVVFMLECLKYDLRCKFCRYDQIKIVVGGASGTR